MDLINYELTLSTNNIDKSSERINNYYRFLNENRVLFVNNGKGFYQVTFQESDSFSKKSLLKYFSRDTLISFLRL